jgi:hypothetical protein
MNTRSKTSGWAASASESSFAAFQIVRHQCEQIAEAGVLGAVDQILEPFQQGRVGAGDLLHVEAEADQVAARGMPAGEQAASRAGARADQGQSHAAQAQIQVDVVDRASSPWTRLPWAVGGAIAEARHGLPVSRGSAS